MNLCSSYQQLLNSKFAERQALNPSYSLRAFARDLKLVPSQASDLLRGKRGLSPKKAQHIAKALKLTPKETEIFVLQVTAETARSRHARSFATKTLSSIVNQNKATALSEDQFRVISDWYHFAILELMTTHGFKSDSTWISKRLGITPKQTEEAVDRLLRLEIIEKKAGRLISKNLQLTTSYDIPSESIRRFNNQVLKKAQQAIVHQDVHEREIGTLTIAIHPEELGMVREFLRHMRQKLNQKLTEQSKKNPPTEVYCLAVQFFRLTQPTAQKEPQK